MFNKNHDCYVGSLPCGCKVAVVMFMPDHQDDLKKILASYRERGSIVDTAVLDEVRAELGECKCGTINHGR